MTPYKLIFEDDLVWKSHSRWGKVQTVLAMGKWSDGSRVTASDAAAIATYLKPDIPKKRAHATRVLDEP